MGYDPLTTLRGFSAVSEMQNAALSRRERLLRLAQDQKQVDQQNQIDAAAKASVVNRPAQSMTTNPGSINVGGVDLSGGNTEVSTPASSQFDPAAFSGRLKSIDPLMAQNYDAQQASIQQKQQDEALARQQKLVQLQNGLADLDTKDRAAADAKRKQIKEVTGKAASLAWAIKNAPPEQKAAGLPVRPQRRHARSPTRPTGARGCRSSTRPRLSRSLDTIIAERT
jgi:hypothetical protein